MWFYFDTIRECGFCVKCERKYDGCVWRRGVSCKRSLRTNYLSVFGRPWARSQKRSQCESCEIGALPLLSNTLLYQDINIFQKRLNLSYILDILDILRYSFLFYFVCGIFWIKKCVKFPFESQIVITTYWRHVSTENLVMS